MVPHTDSLWIAKRVYRLARRAGYARRDAWVMAREIIDTGALPVVPVQRIDESRVGRACAMWERMNRYEERDAEIQYPD